MICRPRRRLTSRPRTTHRRGPGLGAERVMELEPFDQWGAEVDPSDEPTTPPPDPDKPYMWIGGQWVLIVTDTSDDVPSSLDLRGRQRSRELRFNPNHGAGGRFTEGSGDTAGGGTSLAIKAKGPTNLAGGRRKSTLPGTEGGPPVPRASLMAAKTTDEVAATTSAELENIMGRPVPVDFSGMSPDVARETGEGLLMGAEKFPENDLGGVQTYGLGSKTPVHADDPNFESAAFTNIDYAHPGNDQIWVANPRGGEVELRMQYASSAVIGNHAAPSPTGTAVHEFGHVVSVHTSADITSSQVMIRDAAAHGVTTGNGFARYIGQKSSVYASTSPHEAMAEAFTDKLVNGAHASALSKNVYKVIEAYHASRNIP